MKKFFILALFVLGMCNAPVFGMEHEIVLTELYSIMPLDDPDDDGAGGRPNPTQIYATIDGNHLSVGAYTEMPAYVEVIDQETGEVVVEEYFEGEAEVIIEQTGLYIVQIYSAYIAVAGDFIIE